MSTEAVIVGPEMAEAWDAYTLAHPGTIAWQTFVWSEIVQRHYPATFYPIAAMEGDAIRGILPLYHVRTRMGKENLISVPYAVAGGIAADDSEAESLLLDKAIELSKKHGDCRVALKQYKKKVEGDLLTDSNYCNRELQLTTDFDGMYSGFSDVNKAALDAADDQAYEMTYPSSELKAFFEVLLQHHHRRGVPCSSRRWVSDLLDTGMYSMALLRRDGRIVGGTMVKDYKSEISFPFTCCTTWDAEKDAPYFLYWELLKYFATEGRALFHSGRIPRTNDVADFRLGWGGEEQTYFYQYHPNVGGSTEYSSKRGGKRHLLESGWKRMPRVAARVLGPIITREYP